MTMTEVTLVELKADPPAATTVHKWQTPYSGDAPKCDDGEEVVEFGLQDGYDPHLSFAGICAPLVAKDATCPATDKPADLKNVVPTATLDTDGTKTHCQLVCTADADCGTGGSKCLQITVFADSKRSDQKMCLFNKTVTPPPTKKHEFETPYAKEGEPSKCTETDVDVVEFDTSDGKKAGICAPKAPADGTCLADDHPAGSTAVPKSIKDSTGQHCELDCSAGLTCPGKSKCTSVKTVKSQLFAMRLEDGGDCKLCLYDKNSKAAFLMS